MGKGKHHWEKTMIKGKVVEKNKCTRRHKCVEGENLS